MHRRDFFRATAIPLGLSMLAAGSRTARCNALAEEAGPMLGINASLGGKGVFPADNPWNTDISRMPVDPQSDQLIAGIGLDKHLHPDFGTVYQGAPMGIP